jgi:hypothetical protein
VTRRSAKRRGLPHCTHMYDIVRGGSPDSYACKEVQAEKLKLLKSYQGVDFGGRVDKLMPARPIYSFISPAPLQSLQQEDSDPLEMEEASFFDFTLLYYTNSTQLPGPKLGQIGVHSRCGSPAGLLSRNNQTQALWPGLSH